MLWLSIYLPLLPLEIFEQDGNNTCKNNIAILEKNKILLCNKAAKKQGIEKGLNRASALAICNSLTFIERDLNKEKKVLANLAELAYQFSSQVVMYSSNQNQHSLLLEVSGSQRLFSGIKNLTHLIHQQLNKNTLTHCGFSHCFGIGETPIAAQLLARFHYHSDHKSNGLINTKNICDAPISLLNCPAADIQHCEHLGLKTVGNILQLPKSALAKRFNHAFITQLEKLNGETPDLQHFFVPPDFFIREMFFIDGLRNQAGLKNPIKKLLGMLCTYLQQRQIQTHEIIWEFTRFSKNKQQIPIVFSGAQNNFDALLQLSLMHIENLPLDSPVESITLNSQRFSCIETVNQSLFEKSLPKGSMHLLTDTLTAKLGHNALWQVETSNAHLPEKINQLTPFQSKHKNKFVSTKCTQSLPRPAWLLKKPERLSKSNKGLFKGEQTLHIIRGPERIETVWWENHQRRDYFIARATIAPSNDITPSSSTKIITAFYWIYHDSIQSSWYLHGIYG
jgi:protein ImuB